MMRGSSGARFNILGDRVVKMSTDSHVGDRIMAQGMWLRRHQSPAVPEVFQVYAHSYVMERLIVPPFWALDHMTVIHHTCAQLMAHVWSCPPEVPFTGVEPIEAKYRYLCDSFDMPATTLDSIVQKIEWDRLRQCLTHGDPTFENVMFRETSYGGDLVLADPIPASPAVPDLRAVDLGKMLQSALGWEYVRYRGRWPKLRAGTMDVLRYAEDKNEWRAAAFWAAIHILRAFPYVTDDVRAKLKELFHAATRLGL